MHETTWCSDVARAICLHEEDANLHVPGFDILAISSDANRPPTERKRCQGHGIACACRGCKEILELSPILGQISRAEASRAHPVHATASNFN